MHIAVNKFKIICNDARFHPRTKIKVTVYLFNWKSKNFLSGVVYDNFFTFLKLKST